MMMCNNNIINMLSWPNGSIKGCNVDHYTGQNKKKIHLLCIPIQFLFTDRIIAVELKEAPVFCGNT